jgi:hypothetical protein
MSKTNSKISYVYKCPKCGEIATFKNGNGICSTCWGKNKKKIEMKKAIWKPGWDGRILKFNNISILEKLKDVLERNKGATQIVLKPYHPEGPFICFEISSFGSRTLEYIFSYWGLNWIKLVKYFSDVADNTENEGDLHLLVSLWLNEIPNMMDCAHEFKDNKNWKYKICSKCGLFEKMDGD